MFGLRKEKPPETRACYNCGHVVVTYGLMKVIHYLEVRETDQISYCNNCRKPYQIVIQNHRWDRSKGGIPIPQTLETRYYVRTGSLAGQIQYQEV